MISVNNLTFGYRNHEVFQNLSLGFEEGKIYGLLGLNGEGKSTLLYILSGLLKAKSGEVTFKGSNIARRLPSDLQDIYIVPEEFELPNMSLEKYVDINSVFYPNFSRETLFRCIQGFGLDMKAKLGKLSMGQKKKALVCFALATNTSLLLMDEPTNGLDIPSKSQFRKVVSSCMDDDRTIIISTHQVKDVENLIDQIVILNQKSVAFNRNVGEITDKLMFGMLKPMDPNDGVLYRQSVIGGDAAVWKKQNEMEESPLDIELLFNAVLSNPQEINSIF